MLRNIAVASAALTGLQIDIGSWPEKIGFAGLTAFLVYWIVNRVSAQLDEIAKNQKDVTVELAKLIETMRNHINGTNPH